DDHEQHAEREERSVPDARTPEPDDREVGQDHEDERAHHDADAAEEVERPTPVATHEGHAQEIEEAAEVPLGAIARPAMSTRSVVDGDLRDAVATVCREDRDEAVDLP